MSEQRVLATKARIPAPPGRAGGIPAPADVAAAPAKGGRKGRVLVAVVLVLLAGAAAWWFLVGPGASADGEPAAEPPPEPGPVQVVEPISLNLAGGRYLRIGVGLQLTADAHDEVDTAQALDVVIELFSGRAVDEVASAEGRAVLKEELARQLDEAYHGEVIGVYFTDYVTQ